ncbi:MAG: HD domain-containing phosphohydrolase [Pseudomonadota bacterium]
MPSEHSLLPYQASWAVRHYGLIAVLTAIYGGAVCPFIETLTIAQLLAPIAVSFSFAVVVRRLLRKNVLGKTQLEQIASKGFAIDLSLFVGISAVLCVFNMAVFDFPVESGLKLLVGISALGFFAAADAALADEHAMAKLLAQSGKNVRSRSRISSFAKRLTALLVMSMLTIGVVISLLISKQQHHIATLTTLPEVATSKNPILIEMVFVIGVVCAYAIKVVISYVRNLHFLVSTHQNTVEHVVNGELQKRIPVTGYDEFSEIARYTNEMIASLEFRTDQLARTQDVAILSLASLAETRDNETGAHILRTQRYVKVLAQHLAKKPEYADYLTDEVVELLFKSAPLHDIGKVGIPDSILLKPGKLTEEEFEIMKSHTTMGSEALRVAEQYGEGTQFLSFAREIAISHHEKWDGSGYPAGLSGTDIPLSGRIMAMADVYDALITKRVYKPAFSHEKARQIIVDGRGSHFDPAIVDAFLECEETFIQVATVYTDEQYHIAA